MMSFLTVVKPVSAMIENGNSSYGTTGSKTQGNFNIGEAGQGYIPHASVGNYETNFWDLVSSLLSVVIPIAALLVLLYLIWGAFEWITSEGDSGKLEKARKKMMHAIIGIIVIASALAIFALVQQFLGICVMKWSGATAC